jgi:hypothetical protein
MGIFNIFKRNKTTDETVNTQQQTYQPPFKISFSQPENGYLQVEFLDNNKKPNQFYDTTRLIIKYQPQALEGHPVYQCAVSWYNEGDCRMYNEQTHSYENIDSLNYTRVLTEINPNLLQIDQNYCYTVMKELLEQERVNEYINTGLEIVKKPKEPKEQKEQKKPKPPCGNYIGGVKQRENGRYGKFFNPIIGVASHNSDYMKHQRQALKEQDEAKKQAKIAENQAQIAENKAQIQRLQNEIDDLKERDDR